MSSEQELKRCSGCGRENRPCVDYCDYYDYKDELIEQLQEEVERLKAELASLNTHKEMNILHMEMIDERNEEIVKAEAKVQKLEELTESTIEKLIVSEGNYDMMLILANDMKQQLEQIMKGDTDE